MQYIAHKNMTKQEIGNIIKDRRKFLNINQKELAEIIGLGLRSLIDIESGKGNPTIDQLNKVADTLGLSTELKIKSNG
jgi:y4mF family transcriptional regulator